MSVHPEVRVVHTLPVIVVRVVCELDISTIDRLREQLDDALSLHPHRLVVDLGECGFVDAQAMVVLLEAHRAAWAKGGRLVLRGCSAQVLRLLDLAGILEVFEYEVTA